MSARSVSLEQARRGLAELAAATDQLIYPTPPFLDFLALATGAEPRAVVLEENGVCIGALPFLTLAREGVGRVVNALPWYGSHGACVLDDARADADQIRRRLLGTFREAISAPDLLSYTVILSHNEERHRALYAEILEPTAMDSRVGQVTTLPRVLGRNGEALLGVFEKKTRNLARKGLKQGFREIVADDDAAWDVLHRLHAENMHALGGAPKPRAHFEAMRSALAPSMRRLSLALENEEPVAALLLLYGGSTVEYVTPAIKIAARPRQPLTFLIFHGMSDAIARGFTAWNWGGTWRGQQALHHFKAGFGAEDRPYSYLVGAGPEGLEPLQTQRNALGALFPYFYTYPYAQLDAPRAMD